MSDTPAEQEIVRRRSRFVLPLLGSMVVVAGLFVGVFPTRAILDQRADLAASNDRLDNLEARNEDLESRVEALGTDEEIERIAREQYNLVFPGEEAYAILPAAAPPIVVPDAWPFRDLRAAVDAAAPGSP